MKQLLTITLFFLIIFSGFSQTESVTISGKITHLGIPIENVNIHNLQSNYGEITNAIGEFKIRVTKNDTLKISHIKYQTKRIAITDVHLKKDFIEISLTEMTNYLSTVNLKNHDLSGTLLTDLKNVPKDTTPRVNFTMKSLMKLSKIAPLPDSNPVYTPHDVNPIKMNAGVGVGVAIPDKANILRRKLRVKKSLPYQIISEFGEDFFINELKIPKEKIHHFITYCGYRNIRSLYKNNKPIELISVLTEESLIYNKIKN